MPGALDGIRVLDLSQWQQGPYATVILSDMGADVVRVERADWVDRMQGPYGFWVDGRGRRSVGKV